MSFKSSVAAGVGHLSYSVLHDVFNRGSSLPGLIALKIDPDILYHYKDRYDFVIVGGTNGKTTATALAVRLLKRVMNRDYSKVMNKVPPMNASTLFVTLSEVVSLRMK